jgi:hypothetical protein
MDIMAKDIVNNSNNAVTSAIFLHRIFSTQESWVDPG